MFTTESLQSYAVTIGPDASCVEVADLMDEKSVGCVVVADRGRAVGILTDRDVTCRVVADGLDPAKTLARDVMSPDPITGHPDDEPETLLRRMTERKIRRIPLVENDQLVGLVSLDDVIVEVSSHLFNANQGILGGLHESRRTVRQRRRAEAREHAIHELREQLIEVSEDATDRIQQALGDLLDRFGRSR